MAPVVEPRVPAVLCSWGSLSCLKATPAEGRPRSLVQPRRPRQPPAQPQPSSPRPCVGVRFRFWSPRPFLPLSALLRRPLQAGVPEEVGPVTASQAPVNAWLRGLSAGLCLQPGTGRPSRTAPVGSVQRGAPPRPRPSPAPRHSGRAQARYLSVGWTFFVLF